MNGIVCRPHDGIRLTRAACAKRHTSAAKAYGPSSARRGKIWSETCASCEVGKAHERGETPSSWPDGSELVQVVMVPVLIPAGALLRSEPARRRHRARVAAL